MPQEQYINEEATFLIHPDWYLVPLYVLWDIARDTNDEELREWLTSADFEKTIKDLVRIMKPHIDQIRNFKLYNV